MTGRNASEGIERRNVQHRTGARVSFPGSLYRRAHNWRVCGGVPGSESVAGHRTAHAGTWEPHAVSEQASDKLKRRGGRMAAWESDQAVVGE